jgi:DNA polymerase/3'-5' exonuclease PolX
MSDVVVKRDRVVAERDAADLRAMLEGTFERWEVAGSLRRGHAAVGDVDHVLIPKMIEVPGPGLFGGPVEVNACWRALDRLVEEGGGSAPAEAGRPGDEVEDEFEGACGDWSVVKAVRETKNGPRTCWGEKHRAVWFRGCVHELYVAEPSTWGSVMLIRTGPAEFSRWMVTELRRYGFKHEGGRVIDTRKVSEDAVVAVPEEGVLFDLVGIKYREPADRRCKWPDNRDAMDGDVDRAR